MQAPFIQAFSKSYDDTLISMAWCHRKKDKNSRVYFVVKFGPRHQYYIFENSFYKDSIEKFNVMWDNTITITKEIKEFRKHFKNIDAIPYYHIFQKVGESGKMVKVSALQLQHDRYDKPYYFILPTKVIPFRTDTRYRLRKKYYIFHESINKNGTLKNKARLWYATKHRTFQP